MYYKRVSVKDELPTETGMYDTDCGNLYFKNENLTIGCNPKGYFVKGNIVEPVKIWYKPVSLPNGINRDELIKALKAIKDNPTEEPYLGPHEVETIANALLPPFT